MLLAPPKKSEAYDKPPFVYDSAFDPNIQFVKGSLFIRPPLATSQISNSLGGMVKNEKLILNKFKIKITQIKGTEKMKGLSSLR